MSSTPVIREARTTLDPVPTPATSTVPPNEQPAPQPPLAFNEVRLSDGMIVAIRETTADDDDRIEKVLADEGLSLQGLGAVGYTRALALAAIERWGNEEMAPIVFKQQLAPLRRRVKSKDMPLILQKYAEVNGLATGDETTTAGFQGQGR